MTAQQLKNSILQMAVQGKLVPQDPSDEPASVLLERIKAEKQELIKAGKIKKDKKSSEIFRGAAHNLPYAYCEQIGKEIRDISDEIPFEIPESWEWVRLGFIGDWGSGATPSRTNKEYYGGNIPWLKTGDLNDGIITNIPEKITELALEKTSVRLNPVGSVLIAMYGATIGKLGILNIPATTNQACCACLPILVNNNYLFYFLMSHKESFTKKAEGGAQPNISKEKIISTLFPLPPLAEQKRIVAKIEQLIPYIEKYEKAETQLTALNKSFPDMLKKSILQEAVQGKLVPQNPDDEPASVLLERIRAEKQELIKQGKIKKNKNESVIITRDKIPYEIIDGKERCIADEVPFEIPDSWCWCRLGTIFQHNTGKTLNSSNHQGTMMQYITTSNLYWDRFELDKLREMLFTDSEVEKCTVTKGDLLVCEGGDIGRAAIWNYDYPMRIQNHIHRLRSYAPVEVYFFYYVFYLYKRAGLIGGKGIGIQGLSSNAIDKLLIPLPPLAEQKKIVAKIEELMQYCDKL
ncbi:MAG: restriction endonuclease subunit S [Ruminococcus bicirculans (ex Wegman et al. 2014)]|uniref:restriction endonuclease subunit S n=2 Tax=Ruminococcus bicirculans (ex Wegman et al. 2014) TaxID=1160721 RepID=UPI00399252F8